MECKYCGHEIEVDSTFCSYCGKRIDGKRICPKCGTEMAEESKFCKNCGSPLEEPISMEPKKEVVSKKAPREREEQTKGKRMSIAQFVTSVISLCMAAFLVVFSFGVCFAPFISVGEMGMGLFDFIDELQDFKPLRGAGSDFYWAANNLPNVICLVGICLSLVGCTVSLILSTVKGITFGTKGKLPKLNNMALLSTGSLLIGLLFCSMMFTSVSVNLSSMSSATVSMSYGTLVLAVVGMGLAWWFANHIMQLILDAIEYKDKKIILNRCLKLGEVIFLVIIIFNLCSAFLSISSGYTETTTTFSVVSFLSIFSEKLYNSTINNRTFVFSQSDYVIGYYLTIVIFVLFIIFVVLALSLFVFRLWHSEKETKPNLISSISYLGMTVLLLILSICAVEIYKSEKVFNYILGLNSYYVPECSIGGNLIVVVVFAFLLLALEITWFVLNKSMKKSSQEVETNAM